MDKQKPAFRKPLLWASAAYGIFTAIAVIVPIVWDRMANKKQ